MSADEEEANHTHPCCKPLRLLELVVTFLSFVLLFYLRQFHAEDEIFCSPTTLCIFFTTIGSTFAVTILDNLCQGLRFPIPNKPVLLSLVAGAVMCFICGVMAMVVHSSIREKPSSQCLSIVVVGLIVDPTNNGILAFDQNHSGIVYVSWPGYIIINTVLLITHIAGDRVPKRTLVMFSLIGGILYVAASAVVIEDWRKNRTTRIARHTSKQYQDMTISAGTLGLLTAFIMFVETFFHVFGDEEEEEED